MTERTPEAEDMDDGPIVLPEGACCKLCAYAMVVKVPVPSEIIGQRKTADAYFCRRMPPTPIALPDGQGGIQITAQAPNVAPEAVCYEFDMAPLDFGASNG